MKSLSNDYLGKKHTKKHKKIGFTIGKFAPLHKGHQYLLDTAINEMDEVHCVIYDTDITDIPVEERAKWIQKLYPTIHIIYAFNSPKRYGLDSKSVQVQMEYLKGLIKGIDVTHFYSSEPYGEKVAEYLNIENRVVDRYRKRFPISATQIRKDYVKNKKFLEKFIFNKIHERKLKLESWKTNQ